MVDILKCIQDDNFWSNATFVGLLIRFIEDKGLIGECEEFLNKISEDEYIPDSEGNDDIPDNPFC